MGTFIVIHVFDFRVQKLAGNPAMDDLALAVRERIGSPIGAFIYLAGIVALGLHLRHGFSSALQTLGANHPKYNGLIQAAGMGLAALIALGFASFPIYLLATGGGAH